VGPARAGGHRIPPLTHPGSSTTLIGGKGRVCSAKSRVPGGLPCHHPGIVAREAAMSALSPDNSALSPDTYANAPELRWLEPQQEGHDHDQGVLR
jgi:hypothetical protein